VAFLLVSFSALSILVLEQHVDSNIKTAEDAVWWAMSTITTVGYGDRYPVTTEGRMLGMVLMLMGVGMYGGLSGMVASVFLGKERKRQTRLNKCSNA
jgi:voltage-gated potassium channel